MTMERHHFDKMLEIKFLAMDATVIFFRAVVITQMALLTSIVSFGK